MASSNKAKRTLIAYSVLAERLRTPGVSLTAAMTPFWAEVCAHFPGELFDALKFSAKAEELYGFKIPRLAVLGMAEQLAHDGFLSVRSASKDHTVYEYPKIKKSKTEDTAYAISEPEILRLLAAFVSHARQDDRVANLSDEALHEAFLDRLLHLDSMRILSRKDASITAKKSENTLTLNKPQSEEDRLTLHLDFLVSEFLLSLRSKSLEDFEKVSDIAFANMTAEAIACFNEPVAPADNLTGLIVYLDSPLLLDMLGVNPEYAEYGKELLKLIAESGARPAVLDHCIDEAETAVHARLNHSRSGVNKISYGWGENANPAILSALIGHVGERAFDTLNVEVHKDPDVEPHKKYPTAVGSIETEMERRMQAWSNAEAKSHDRKSVWSMLAMRNTYALPTKICDSRNILLARNTALVSIANNAWRTWLNETTKNSRTMNESSAPLAMSDKQFAGYLWLRAGGANTGISKTRLLAHCSSAVRPRSDVKASAYNLVLELSGLEAATHIMALMEDREGAFGLMRATYGDPADVTPERLPYILEQVKLAAGDFAAAKEREKGEEKISEIKKAHAAEKAAVTTELQTANTQLAEKTAENHAINQQLEILSRKRAEKRRQVLLKGLAAGTATFKRLRWVTTLGFGVFGGLISQLPKETPAIISFGIAVVAAVAGFWFVPDILNKPFMRLAKSKAKKVVAALDNEIVWPDERADFQIGVLTDADGTKLSYSDPETIPLSDNNVQDVQ